MAPRATDPAITLTGSTGVDDLPPVERPALRGTVVRLTSVNVAVLAMALLTGPIQARALGVQGRGELAAILAPVGLLPLVASVGLATYATRAAAQGRAVDLLVGTLVRLSFVIGIVAFVLCIPLANYLADG